MNQINIILPALHSYLHNLRLHCKTLHDTPETSELRVLQMAEVLTLKWSPKNSLRTRA